MPQETITLARAIKRELDRVNYKGVCVVFSMLGVIGGFSLLGLLALVGTPLKILTMMIIPSFGVPMITCGIVATAIIGIAVGFGFGRYSKSKLTPYANILKDIEMLKNLVIDIWLFVTAKENKNSETYESFNESWKDRIRQGQQDSEAQHEINKNNDAKIKKITDDYNTLYRFVGRKNQEDYKKAESESEKDIELQKLRRDLRTAISSIATSQEKITELENRIKDLEGKK